MSYLELRGKDCRIILEERPYYCDRGRLIAKVFPIRGSRLALDLDDADGWPRYYFFRDCAYREVEAWLRVRNQWLPDAGWEEHD